MVLGAWTFTVAIGVVAAQERPATAYPLDPKWRDFVHTIRLQPAPLPTAFRATGKVTYDETRTQHVAAPVAGRVTDVTVNLGDQVEAGTPLMALSSPEAGALQADIMRAQQALSLASRGWERTQQLRADGAVSSKEAAQAESDYKVAQAEYQRLTAQRRALGLTSKDAGMRLVLRARQAGTVVERNVRLGQEVRGDSGDVLMTLSDLDAVWVQADLYEQDLGRLHVGDPVQVSVAAYPHAIFPGEVAALGDILDPQTRTLKVRCRVPNAARRLKPEMFATVALARPDRLGLVVPSTAVVRQGAQLFVLVTDEAQHNVRERPVQLGPAHGGQQQVLGGLTEGETIITDGALFVHHALHAG
jgi:cobalt-zinc-cadmium efflux system membrane fusion protein